MDPSLDGEISRAPTTADLGRICAALNASGARYVVIGGFAVITHGFARTTKDIDLLVDPSPENIERIKAALAVLPDNAAAEVGPNDVLDYSVVRIADEVVIDLLGSACEITYEVAIRTAETFEIDGTPVPVASPATLLLTKRTVRPSDQTDRDFLEHLQRERRAP
jgi:Nucleotidyl transferase AbiEii toxin, Type IV TA system